MSQIKKIGKRMEITPQKEILGGIKPAENSDEAVTLGQLRGYGGIKPYLKYTAILTQASTNAPTAVVLENSIGAIEWTYNGVGSYTATLTGAFTLNKTFILLGTDETIDGSFFAPRRTGVNTITLQSRYIDTGLVFTSSNDLIVNLPIEIRIYQ